MFALPAGAIAETLINTWLLRRKIGGIGIGLLLLVAAWLLSGASATTATLSVYCLLYLAWRWVRCVSVPFSEQSQIMRQLGRSSPAAIYHGANIPIAVCIGAVGAWLWFGTTASAILAGGYFLLVLVASAGFIWWEAVGRARTEVETYAMPSDSPAGLIEDCEALLTSRDVLCGGPIQLNSAADLHRWAQQQRAQNSIATLNWSAYLDLALWEGIGTDEGRVAIMDLSGHQLWGEIFPELGKLTNVQALDLSNNDLSNEIPPELGSLKNLEFLRLADNQLTGTIPSKLGNLTKLEHLDLSDNELTDAIPPALARRERAGLLSVTR